MRNQRRHQIIVYTETRWESHAAQHRQQQTALAPKGDCAQCVHRPHIVYVPHVSTLLDLSQNSFY